jgi:hypothetical protein
MMKNSRNKSTNVFFAESELVRYLRNYVFFSDSDKNIHAWQYEI